MKIGLNEIGFFFFDNSLSEEILSEQIKEKINEEDRKEIIKIKIGIPKEKAMLMLKTLFQTYKCLPILIYYGPRKKGISIYCKFIPFNEYFERFIFSMLKGYIIPNLVTFLNLKIKPSFDVRYTAFGDKYLIRSKFYTLCDNENCKEIGKEKFIESLEKAIRNSKPLILTSYGLNHSIS